MIDFFFFGQGRSFFCVLIECIVIVSEEAEEEEEEENEWE